MTVEKLVRTAAGGDEDAFAELVRLYENKVYQLALRMCSRPEDAVDVAQEAFLSAYPECKDRTKVLYNLIDRDRIVKKAKEPGGFSDGFDGFRILTVGRLVPEKAHDIKIRAMEILKRARKGFRWYVLGEGKLRKKLENQIRRAGLEKDFILLGTVNNPFPYYAQCDLYVHGTYLEGKSVAIEEAQILGCAILVSDYSGVQEQVRDGIDGEVCKLDPGILAEKILNFADHPKKREAYGLAAAKRERANAFSLQISPVDI